MAIVDRFKSLFRAGEGSARGPVYGLGELGGWPDIVPKGDGWQRQLEVDIALARQIPAVFASVLRIAKSGCQ